MKKGFTLTELLAVIVIMGIIGLIAIPNVQNLMERHKNNMLQIQERNIESAARSWGADHTYLLPTLEDASIKKTYEEVKNGTDQEYGELVITLELLQNNGYIGKEIKNSVTKKDIDPKSEIHITYGKRTIEYNFVLGE